jgi:hypothetical protein
MRHASAAILLMACLVAPAVTRSDQKGPSKTGTTISPAAKAQMSANRRVPDLVCRASAYKDEAGSQPLGQGTLAHPTGAKLNAWIVVTVQNKGMAPASSFTVRLNTDQGGLSQNPNGPFTWNPNLGPMSLGAMASLDVKVKWQIACETQSYSIKGPDAITVFLDNTNVVSEADEKNNTCGVGFMYDCAQ